MRFVVFGDDARVGLLEGETVLDLSRAAQGEAGFGSLLELIEAGEAGLERARSAAERARVSGAVGTPLSKAKLQAPWAGQRLALAGSNNADHHAAAFTSMGTPLTKEDAYANQRAKPPSAFWAMARPVMGPGAKIEIPARARGFFDYEGEAAVVIGKRGKDIKANAAHEYIWGVTLVNDWSAREDVWPPVPPNALILAKNFDCSKSIGPTISVGEADINDMPVETLVNGELRQSYSTRDMSYGFAEILEFLSRDFTFYPGDVISLGTGAGTGIDRTVPMADGRWPTDKFLKPGDTVEVRSPAVGSLIGHVVPKST